MSNLCCHSCDNEIDRLEREINRAIERERKKMRRQIKVLFLGTGEAGKSTIVKQMKIIHGDGYANQERMSYVRHIHSNLLESIQLLVGAMRVKEIAFQDPSNEHLYNTFLRDLDFNHLQQDLRAEILLAIRTLWLDDGVQQAFQLRREFHLSDSTEYFMERITNRPPTPPPLDLDDQIPGTATPRQDTRERLPIVDPNYIPRNSDIVRVRVRTRKIEEYSFRIGRAEFLLVDVGGQSTERRKWIHCFENVTLIMFIASLSEYDQTMFERPGVNRMRESLALFDVILNYREYLGKDSYGIWFLDVPVVLFLNKADIFDRKIANSDLSAHFPEYTGPSGNVEEGREYILTQYIDTRTDPRRDIFTHFTTATDTRQMEFLFNVGRHSILQRALTDFNPF
ncbi:guanine nucleotide-binding protein subunit alpha-14-like isoform X2 [Paramacrobiotus metropolitanus]|uniref:guanine nucleotide-binding protein subunit alpha-14-like isoform X2 n=1 Tax=Paramacrobiotus metropolitanus TaxID=2943436 RepID=UPI002445CAFB|nr:guanine nucleotide-binding protein subunit alpha-14-like isoform X2 [Paramacrobiotus metropolitanus]